MRERAQAIGADLTVQSQPGHGTEIKVVWDNTHRPSEEKAQMSTPSPIRVMVVDDHGMVRRGIVAYLKSNADILVVGEAENGREALDACEQLAPNVILMDLTMPEMDTCKSLF